MPKVNCKAVVNVSESLAALGPKPLGWTERHKQHIVLAFIAARGLEGELARFAGAVAAEEATVLAAAKGDEGGLFSKVVYYDPPDPDVRWPGAETAVLIPVRLVDALGLAQAFYSMTNGVDPVQILDWHEDELYDKDGNLIEPDDEETSGDH